jgi:uncharacterized DUF497 family protein
MDVRFTWNETKRRQIPTDRGFDLLRAARIFRAPVFIKEDNSHDDCETRYIALGFTEGEYFTVVFTPRQDPVTAEDVYHLIPAWRMGRRGRRRYHERYPG